MAEETILISEVSHRALCELSQRTGQPLRTVLDQAIAEYRRKVFFESLNAGYAALRADPHAWAEEQAERKLWEATHMDGLDSEERWSKDGQAITPAQGEQGHG